MFIHIIDPLYIMSSSTMFTPTIDMSEYKNFNIIPVADEYDNENIANIVLNTNKLIVLGLFAGVGKSTCFKNALKDKKEEALFVCPSNRLCYEYKTEGFKSCTYNKLLRVGVNKVSEKRMKAFDITGIKYIVCDEIYSLRLVMRTKLQRFMNKHEEIHWGATGDPRQLPSPKCTDKEYNYVSSKMYMTFKNCIILKEIKRCSNPEDKERMMRIYDMIHNKSRPFDLEYKKIVFGDFPTMEIKDIPAEANVITYLKESGAVVNATLNMKKGGMSVGDLIVVKKKLDRKKDGMVFHVNCEFVITAKGIDYLKIKDCEADEEDDEEYTITRSEFGNHFSLAYSITNHACQGVSLSGTGVICDLSLPFADERWCWVAISRFRDLSKVHIVWNDAKLNVENVKNFTYKIQMHKEEDKAKGRVYDDKDYVNFPWFLEQLKKQLFRCYNDECNCTLALNYETGDMTQYSIDRKDSSKAHTRDNCRLLCLQCNVTYKDKSNLIED